MSLKDYYLKTTEAPVDINEIGVLYVKDLSRQYQKEERTFDPNTIQDFELRDGEMRRYSTPYGRYYNRERLRQNNQYPGMWS